MLADFKRYWHNDSDELEFLLDFDDAESRQRHRKAAALAVAAELVLVGLVSAAFSTNAPMVLPATQIVVDTRRATPLVAPTPDELKQFRLTQKEPQRGQPVAEVDLAGLLPRPATPGTPPGPPPSPASGPRRQFLPPGSSQQSKLEAPKIDLPAQGVQSLPSAPPPILAGPPPDKPKVAFEQVGPPAGTPTGSPAGTAVKPPKLTVDEAVKSMTRSGGAGGPIVGDTGAFEPGGIGEMMRQNQAPGRPGSALQLLSDPQGVDFRPYLTQVLASVKRNWMAVFPESARMGQRGRTIVQFSVNRVGQVPKLVISMPAGIQALDRAAVAGVSASIPFPPLPAEFRGGEIRLQLVFTYNMPSR